MTDIVDGDTVWLDTGVQVRLTGIQAPKLALGRVGFEDWPLAHDAKRALTDLALGRRLALLFDGQREDRHGRVLAHLVRDDGVWLQGAMVAAGMARAYSFADNRIAATALLAIEAQARGDRLGIWAHPYYAIRRPDQTDALIDSFQIVEGRVEAADRVRDRIYLNFGKNWRDDFTVSVATRDVDVFTAAGIDLLDLEGRTVRARGWLNRRNGPMIEIDHPEQIEIVEDR
ncbi:MAG: thermonuclease family protein [Inquilinaceae bacterium]